MRRFTALVGTSTAVLSLLAACSDVKAPVAAAADVAAIVNAGDFVQLDGSASADPQKRPLSYNWTIISRPLGSQATLIAADTAKPSFKADLSGDYLIRLIVSNNVLSSPPVDVTVTVSPCGARAPEIKSITASAATPSIGATVQLQSDVLDADNGANCNKAQTLSSRWELLQQPAGSLATLNNASSQTPSLTPDRAGDYAVRLIVTDSTGLSSPAKTIVITVPNCGANAPTVTASADSPVVQPTSTVHLSAVALDADIACGVAQTFTYQWAISSKPAGSAAVLSNSTASNPTLTPDAVGIYELSVVAIDNTGLKSQPSAVVVVANPCGGPALTNARFTTSPADSTPPILPGTFRGDRVNLAVNTAPGICGALSQQFSFSWSLAQRPAGSTATLSSTTDAAPFFIADVAGGSYLATVTVRDGFGTASATAQVAINVSNCGNNPILASATDTNVNARPFDPRFLAVQPAAGRAFFSDDDDQALCPARFARTYTFSWTATGQTPRPGTFSAPSTSLTTFTPGGSAIYGIEARVFGSDGRSVVAPVFVNSNCFATPVDISPLAADFTGNAQTGEFPRGFSVFRDDQIKLAGVATSNCFRPAFAGLTYQWTLTASESSSAQLSSSNGSQTSFTVDQPNGFWTATLVAFDALGNPSAPQSKSFQATACGANPIAASVQDTPGAAAFDDHTLRAVPASGPFFSGDDDPAQCPSHFAGQYSFDWSVASTAPSTGFVFDTTHGTQVKFTPGGNAVYSVHLLTSGSLRNAETLQNVSASCADLAPRAGALSLASSTPGFAPGVFFRDDVATLSAAPSSLCFSPGSTSFSYAWTLQSVSGGNTALSLATAASPTFSVNRSAGTWTASVVVVDKLGNRSAPSLASFISELCGNNPVVATLGAPVQTLGTLAFDPYTFSASATSVDDDIARCPARFSQTYSIAFSVGSVPAHPAVLTAPAASGIGPRAPVSTNLLPGGNATYTVTARATGSKILNTGPAQRDVLVNCTDPFPTKVTAPSIGAVTPPAAGDDAFDLPHFFRDDTLTLTAQASSTCFSLGNTSFTYAWTLSPLNPPALSDATTQTPFFVVNTPGGAYTATVVATDGIANASQPAQSTFTAENCGANPVRAAVQDATDGLPFDPHALTVGPFTPPFFSTDDDPASCPVRFAQTYSFAWNVTPPLGAVAGADFTFSSTAATASFAAGTNGTYDISVVVTGSKQGSDTQHDLISVNCATPAPTVTAPAISNVLDPQDFLKDGKFFAGDTVTVASTVTHNCFTGANFLPAFSWSIFTDDPGANFVDSLTTTQQFSSTIPNGNYALTLSAQDQWHHASSETTSFTSSPCGASPVTAEIVTAATGLPMDPWTLTAKPIGIFFSDDSNPDICPTRFAPLYTFAWTSTPAAAFSDPVGNPTTFTPADHVSYLVQVAVSGHQTGLATATVNANCDAPTVTTPTVVAVNGAPAGPEIFVDDAVQVTADVTSNCFVSPAPGSILRNWTLAVNGGPAPELFTPSAVDVAPTFKPQTFGGSYAVTLAASDGSHQTGTSAALSVQVSACGATPPTVSLVQATQHFVSIKQVPPGGALTAQSLDILLASEGAEPQVTVGTDLFPVPFYLATPVQVGVRVDSSAGGTCTQFGFVSAQVLGPDNLPIPAADFTAPAAGSVTNGGELAFSFTPRTGDVAGPSAVPGNYHLVVSLNYGRAASAFSTQAGPTVHVGGRCGLNAPFADFDLSPGPIPMTSVGTPLLADATTLSTDADNVELRLLTGTPNFSDGCGLQQTLSYAWRLTVVPPGSTTAALTTPTGPTTSFTPDVEGDYSLKLSLSDGTGTQGGT